MNKKDKQAYVSHMATVKYKQHAHSETTEATAIAGGK